MNPEGNVQMFYACSDDLVKALQEKSVKINKVPIFSIQADVITDEYEDEMDYVKKQKKDSKFNEFNEKDIADEDGFIDHFHNNIEFYCQTAWYSN